MFSNGAYKLGVANQRFAAFIWQQGYQTGFVRLSVEDEHDGKARSSAKQTFLAQYGPCVYC